MYNKTYGFRTLDLYRVNDFLASSVCYTRLHKQIIFVMQSTKNGIDTFINVNYK